MFLCGVIYTITHRRNKLPILFICLLLLLNKDLRVIIKLIVVKFQLRFNLCIVNVRNNKKLVAQLKISGYRQLRYTLATGYWQYQ